MAPKKRPARAPKAEETSVPSALVVKGLGAEDIAALEAVLARRRAPLTGGATLSRNNLVVALIREAIAADMARAEEGGDA